MDRSILEERKKGIEKEFTNLEATEKQLLDQGKALNQKLSDVRSEKIRLQGSFREISSLLGTFSKEEEKLKISSGNDIPEILSPKEEVKEMKNKK